MPDSNMPDSKTSSPLRSIVPYVEFFVGIFGAMAIIGVFFKIQQYPGSEIFMILGFMGEAAAFVVMGSLALLTHFFGADAAAGEEEAAATGQAAIRNVMEERLGDELEPVMESMAQEVERFGEQMSEMSSEMARTRSALDQMHEALGEAADGRLAERAHALGDRMEEMHAQLQQSGAKIEGAYAALEQMEAGLSRAADGTLPEDAERLEKSMKALGNEVQAMSGEMGPARAAVEHMCGQLEQVTSGHLVESAERLGQGMNHLGGEMDGARHAVESLRSDLDEMAARFQRFNLASGDGAGSNDAPEEPAPGRRNPRNDPVAPPSKNSHA
jgi:predicted  nucleic acid-binding Zn-ribbon protein